MNPPTTFAQLVDVFLGLINLLIQLIFSVAFLVIVWKIVDAWVINAGDESKRAEGKATAVVGVIVLVVLVSVWGILTLLRTSIF